MYAQERGAIPCWKYDANTNGDANLNPNGHGSPDSDNDGCSNKEEAGANSSQGGNRDALWPYDFTDVPGPVVTGLLSGSARRSRTVVLADVSAVLPYVGVTSSNVRYRVDMNVDGMADGLQFDRTPSGGGHQANAPKRGDHVAGRFRRTGAGRQ